VVNKKTAIFLSLLFLFTTLFLSADIEDKALSILKKSIVVDTHEDTPTRIYHGADISTLSNKGHIDFPRLAKGGLNSPVFAIWIPNRLDNKQPEVYALKVLASTLRIMNKNKKIAEVAYSSDDIKDITKNGKISVTLSLENSSVFHSEEYVDIFYKLGIRMASFTHMKTNYLSDSSTDKSKWGGISPLGEKLVKRMNELGMIIDVSHLSDKAAGNIIKLSKAPIIASHSCVRNLCNVSRNLPDRLIKAIAENGGYIGINFASFFLDENLRKKREKIMDEYRQKLSNLKEIYPEKGNEYKAKLNKAKQNLREKYAVLNKVKPDLKIIVDHIKYIKELVGIDYVGLGSDFDGIGDSAPIGMEDATCIPDLVIEMLKAGFTESEIKKFLGLNFLRVYKDVEQVKSVNL